MGDIESRAAKAKKGLSKDNSMSLVISRAKIAGHGKGTTTENMKPVKSKVAKKTK